MLSSRTVRSSLISFEEKVFFPHWMGTKKVRSYYDRVEVVCIPFHSADAGEPSKVL